MKRRFTPQPSASGEELVARARRLQQRGEARKALLTLRRACHSEESSARLWSLYGAHLLRLGKLGDANDALTRAAWLFERHHAPKRADAVRRLLARVEQQRFAA